MMIRTEIKEVKSKHTMERIKMPNLVLREDKSNW